MGSIMGEELLFSYWHRVLGGIQAVSDCQTHFLFRNLQNGLGSTDMHAASKAATTNNTQTQGLGICS